MLQGMAHHFAISLGAFCIGRICSNFACIRGGGSLNSPYAWFSAFHVDSKLILFYKRAYWGVTITIMHSHMDHHHAISHFPIGPKANGDRFSTRFLKL